MAAAAAVAICFLLSLSPAQTNAGATGGSAYTGVMGKHAVIISRVF